MTRIAPVLLENNPKIFWFDAQDFEIDSHQAVVVETVRGTEFALMAGEVFDATQEQVDNLKSPLKPVVRIATPQDIAFQEEMRKKSAEALPIYKEIVSQSDLDIHPVSVEYLLSGDKAIFYFESEQRIDFRELVRKLAAQFRVRVDMRQIGARDESRMIGGYAHCGQELCCKRLGGEFMPVSIRMAKEQNLSLNPQKISGLCGRLMCCLRYECDIYKDFNKRAPKRGDSITTPDGLGKVIELDVLHEMVSIKVEDEKPVSVPLESIINPTGSKKPASVVTEAWVEAQERINMTMTTLGPALMTSQFSGNDKLLDAKSLAALRKNEEAYRMSKQSKEVASAQFSDGKESRTEVERPEGAKKSSRKPRKRQTKIERDSTISLRIGESQAYSELLSEDTVLSSEGYSLSVSSSKESGASKGSSKRASRYGSKVASRNSTKSGSVGKQGQAEERPGTLRKASSRKAGAIESQSAQGTTVVRRRSLRKSGRREERDFNRSITEEAPKRSEVKIIRSGADKPASRPGQKSSGVKGSAGRVAPQSAQSKQHSTASNRQRNRPDASKRSNPKGTTKPPAAVKPPARSNSTTSNHGRRARRRSHTLEGSE